MGLEIRSFGFGTYLDCGKDNQYSLTTSQMRQLLFFRQQSPEEVAFLLDPRHCI